jgi:hypothetical protein
MSESEGDKWRKWMLDLVKMALPAILAWYGTDYMKQKEVDQKAGALDTCNGVVYTGQSPAYYEGFHEQVALEVEEDAAAAEEGK